MTNDTEEAPREGAFTLRASARPRRLKRVTRLRQIDVLTAKVEALQKKS